MARVAEYRLTPAAERDLEEIWVYTSQHWSANKADRYIDVLTTEFGELANSPFIAPGCDHIRPGYRRRRVGRHVVYFRVMPYGIAIVRVLHERMDTSHKF